MFRTITDGTHSITEPIVAPEKLLALAELILAQNAEVLRLNRELLAVIRLPLVTAPTTLDLSASGSNDSTSLIPHPT